MTQRVLITAGGGGIRISFSLTAASGENEGYSRSRSNATRNEFYAVFDHFHAVNLPERKVRLKKKSLTQ